MKGISLVPHVDSLLYILIYLPLNLVIDLLHKENCLTMHFILFEYENIIQHIIQNYLSNI